MDSFNPCCNCLNKKPVSIRASSENGGVFTSPCSQTKSFSSAFMDQLYVRIDIFSSNQAQSLTIDPGWWRFQYSRFPLFRLLAGFNLCSIEQTLSTRHSDWYPYWGIRQVFPPASHQIEPCLVAQESSNSLPNRAAFYRSSLNIDQHRW